MEMQIDKLGFGARPVRRPSTDGLGSNGRLIMVPGGEAVLLDVMGGDHIRICDPTGDQPVVVGVFDLTGGSTQTLLEFSKDAPKIGDLSDVTLNPTQEDVLKQRSINLRQATSYLASQFDPGELINAKARTSGRLLIAAPGSAGGAGSTGYPTDIEIRVHRPYNVKNLLMPAPLAEPIDEFIVDRRTAKSYELAAGQYVQVLDIDGRQCSDFQAFSRRALDAGKERFIDTTVTRSLTRTAYPGPGLFNRYYDQDVNPLVEVMHDTCGRHDTFGLACLQRGYENNGFFNHPSCSENIADQMEAWDVERRQAWSAINLFYNTHVGAANVILGDESWSQPGDYVLMQAVEDTVCVSTACPDDTSPINGWNPTDILVRIYAADANFSPKKGFRMSPTAPTTTTRETGFHPRTSALTRHYSESKDYWVPTLYSHGGVTEEYWATRDAVSIQDLSSIEKVDIIGPDAEALLDYALPRDIRRLGVGRMTYSPILRTHGGVFDDGVLFRLSPTAFRWMCSATETTQWLRDLAQTKGLDANVHRVSRYVHNLAVQGQCSRDALMPIVWVTKQQPKLDELKPFQFLVGRLGHREGPAIMVSRSGYTGELGYEVFCEPKDGPEVWDAIMAAGEPFGIKPMGLDALNIIRMEAGLAAGGAEFEDSVNPFEAGMGFAVPLAKKTEDFVGRTALERASQAPRRALVGLTFETAEPVAHGDPVFSAEKTQAGIITSACFSPRTGTYLAMARLEIDYAEPDRILEVGRLGGDLKRLRATVVKLPFFRP